MIAISSSVLGAGVILYGFSMQIILGKPWGDNPISDSGLIITSIFAVAVVGLTIWLLLSTKLEIRIDAKRIQYRYYPIMRKWAMLLPDQIEEFEVKKLGFLERGRRGYRGFFGKEKKLTIMGRHALKIRTADGRKVIIGTQSPEQLERAMKKLMTKPEPGI